MHPLVRSTLLRRALLASSLLLLPGVLPAQQPALPDAKVQADAQKQLKGKRLEGVTVQVAGGVPTLSGQVKLLSDKQDAENKVGKMKEAASIQNNILVAPAESVSDAELQAKLGKALVYGRQGYGGFRLGGFDTTMFNNILLGVHEGVATLSGLVYSPADRNSAVGLVTNTEGVKGMVDQLQVAPTSPMDDRVRIAEARALYGYGPFTKYAINPVKPIRILVVNGHVTLAGVVDNTGDKDIAGIRANTVPGVFSVSNQLQVQGQQPER